MKNLIQLCLLLVTLLANAQSKYKTLVQMANYSGDPAYVIVSIIDKNETYKKTLAVLGTDKKWYKNLKKWYQAQLKNAENVDAVTSASISSGTRAVKVFTIPEEYVNQGYILRFEVAVEDQPYKENDVEIPLTSELITQKTGGKKYIRFVKLSPVN